MYKNTVSIGKNKQSYKHLGKKVLIRVPNHIWACEGFMLHQWQNKCNAVKETFIQKKDTYN